MAEMCTHSTLVNADSLHYTEPPQCSNVSSGPGPDTSRLLPAKFTKPFSFFFTYLSNDFLPHLWPLYSLYHHTAPNLNCGRCSMLPNIMFSFVATLTRSVWYNRDWPWFPNVWRIRRRHAHRWHRWKWAVRWLPHLRQTSILWASIKVSAYLSYAGCLCRVAHLWSCRKILIWIIIIPLLL